MEVINLNHYHLIRVQGPDALTFLQGQLTCDMNEITPTQYRLAAHCNIQGRVRNLFRIFMHTGAYFLQLPAELSENAVTSLKKYAKFSKIELENKKAELQKIGIYGIEAPLFLKTDWVPNTSSIFEHNVVLHLPSPDYPRFEIIGADLSTHFFSEKKPEFWRLLDILAKVPEIYPETVESFLPHYINLPQLQGVSFSKGCYCGQEVIARMEYKAKIKRHLYIVELKNTEAQNPLLKPGTLLFSENTPNHSVATVVMSAFSKEKQTQMLLVECLDEYASAGGLYCPTQKVQLQFLK